MMATWPTMIPPGRAGEGSARRTSWRSWPSTTGSLSPVTRGRCWAAKACTPLTSLSGVEPGRPGRWPAWPGRAALGIPHPRAGRAGTRPSPEPAPGSRAGPHPSGVGDGGKSTRALGTALRERGLRAAVEQVIEPAFAELAPLVHPKRACLLLGTPRASYYRRRRPRPSAPTRPRPSPPNALSPTERQQVLDLLHAPRFCDLPPAQVWARLLDDGGYLAWISTRYRLLGAQGESRDRRRQRTHPARVTPQLVATRPNDVWSWDITNLPGPDRGSCLDL
jgi:hypothetical protein